MNNATEARELVKKYRENTPEAEKEVQKILSNIKTDIEERGAEDLLWDFEKLAHQVDIITNKLTERGFHLHRVAGQPLKRIIRW